MPYKKKGAKASKSSDKAPSVNTKKNVEDDIDSDNEDISSMISEAGSVEDDPVSEYEEYERKIVGGIEMATEKNKKTRINGMKQLISAMQNRSPIYSEIVYKNYFTICDIVETCLNGRSSSDEEKVAAVLLAKVLVVVCMAMKNDVKQAIPALRCRTNDAVDSPVVEVYYALFPSLLKCLLDTTTSALLRAAVSRAVAVLAYFAAPDSRKLCDAVNALYKAFEGALPKGDGVLPTLSPSQHQLHAAALEGFLLLLSRMKSSDILARRTGLLRDLTETLRTAHLDVRCEAGVGIALLFELLYEDESSAENLRHKELKRCIEILEPLATDAQKFRAKKERKEQRHIFRAVLSTVESEGEFQDQTSHIFRVKGNNTELTVESWEDQIKYEVISAVLGEGLGVHMVHNNGLRNRFCVSDVRVTGKRGKEAKTALAEQAKFRQQNRVKTREMRQNAKNILDEEYF